MDDEETRFSALDKLGTAFERGSPLVKLRGRAGRPAVVDRAMQVLGVRDERDLQILVSVGCAEPFAHLPLLLSEALQVNLRSYLCADGLGVRIQRRARWLEAMVEVLPDGLAVQRFTFPIVISPEIEPSALERIGQEVGRRKANDAISVLEETALRLGAGRSEAGSLHADGFTAILETPIETDGTVLVSISRDPGSRKIWLTLERAPDTYELTLLKVGFEPPSRGDGVHDIRRRT